MSTKSTERFNVLYALRISSKNKSSILVAQSAVWNGINLDIPQKEDESVKAKKTRELLGSALILNEGLTQFAHAFECVKSGKSNEVLLTVDVTHTGEVNEYGAITNVNLVSDNTDILIEQRDVEARKALSKMTSAAPKKVSQFSLSDFLDEEEEEEEEVVNQIAEPKKATTTA